MRIEQNSYRMGIMDIKAFLITCLSKLHIRSNNKLRQSPHKFLLLRVIDRGDETILHIPHRKRHTCGEI